MESIYIDAAKYLSTFRPRSVSSETEAPVNYIALTGTDYRVSHWRTACRPCVACSYVLRVFTDLLPNPYHAHRRTYNAISRARVGRAKRIGDSQVGACII